MTIKSTVEIRMRACRADARQDHVPPISRDSGPTQAERSHRPEGETSVAVNDWDETPEKARFGAGRTRRGRSARSGSGQWNPSPPVPSHYAGCSEQSRNAHESACGPIRTLVARRFSRRGATAEETRAGAGRGRAVGQCLPLTDRDRQAGVRLSGAAGSVTPLRDCQEASAVGRAGRSVPRRTARTPTPSRPRPHPRCRHPQI